jgi:hydrogen peroxide-dependent heme synthase
MASDSPNTVAYPPETLEGWYALHQVFTVDREPRAARTGATVTRGVQSGVSATQGNFPRPEQGWTAFVRLIGSRADVMVVHLRPTLEEIGAAQSCTLQLPVVKCMRPTYSFLSVTEAGLYHLSAELSREATERGGSVGDETYMKELATRAAAERDTPRAQRRLYPPIPDGMPYVCFYPMNKTRDTGQNWYTLTLDERSRLMWAHGLTGRRYAGRVVQIITGAIGFDAWEWGVTLFAKDPLDFKKLVTDMRFDEVSAKYAAFGDFYVGTLMQGGVAELEQLVETATG